MKAVWRVIDSGETDGVTNMAVDEALLSCFDPQRSPPVLRLYGWSPPALSLGRFQRAEEVLDLERCRTAGVPVVRRVTGGGVIYHADELTYAVVCAPDQLPEGGTVKETFKLLTSFLLDFYRRLGLAPSFAEETARPGERLGARTEFCFAGRESCDVVLDGRKIGGNAQRRLKNALLQHGSIPLVDRSAEGASFLLRKPEGLREGIASLGELGVTEEVGELKRLLTEAFRERLGVELELTRLTTEEGMAAEKLKAFT